MTLRSRLPGLESFPGIGARHFDINVLTCVGYIEVEIVSS